MYQQHTGTNKAAMADAPSFNHTAPKTFTSLVEHSILACSEALIVLREPHMSSAAILCQLELFALVHVRPVSHFHKQSRNGIFKLLPIVIMHVPFTCSVLVRASALYGPSFVWLCVMLAVRRCDWGGWRAIDPVEAATRERVSALVFAEVV